MTTNDITGEVITVAIDIHRRLGPGLLESVYQAILTHELKKRGYHVDVEVPVPVIWDDLTLDLGFRADVIVNNEILVELKSVESTAPVHKKQVLTYLKVSGRAVGLLLNFGQELMKNGIHRIVNEFQE